MFRYICFLHILVPKFQLLLLFHKIWKRILQVFGSYEQKQIYCNVLLFNFFFVSFDCFNYHTEQSIVWVSYEMITIRMHFDRTNNYDLLPCRLQSSDQAFLKNEEVSTSNFIHHCKLSSDLKKYLHYLRCNSKRVTNQIFWSFYLLHEEKYFIFEIYYFFLLFKFKICWTPIQQSSHSRGYRRKGLDSDEIEF